MSDIINSENKKATITKYQFGKIELDGTQEEIISSNIFKNEDIKTKDIITPEEEDKKDKNSGELLEKIDLLTSQIVDLQMELDKQSKEFQEKLETEKKVSYEKGNEEGVQDTTQTFQTENEELKNQLIRSITLLDEKTDSIDKMFKNIEEDLVESAIVIATKIIKKEIDKDSAKIAKSIASALIERLKDSTNITIKVNIDDAKEISEHFNSDSINIIPDEAINHGGVIILSDETNIDATISTRLSKAIELIGKE